jgi:hypothetical protein
MSKIFNIVWTAGFNSGGRIAREAIVDGKYQDPEELKAKAEQCLKEDAESIMTLIDLEQQMSEG